MTYSISPVGWSIAVAVKAVSYAALARKAKGQCLGPSKALLFGVARALLGLVFLLVIRKAYLAAHEPHMVAVTPWLQFLAALMAGTALVAERFFHWYAWATVAFPDSERGSRRSRATYGVVASFATDVLVLLLLSVTPWAWDIMSMSISMPSPP